MNDHLINQMKAYIKGEINNFDNGIINNGQPFNLMEGIIKNKINSIAQNTNFLIAAEVIFTSLALNLGNYKTICKKDRYFLCFPSDDVAFDGITKINIKDIINNIFNYIYSMSDITKALNINQSTFWTTRPIISDGKEELSFCKEGIISAYNFSFMRTNPDETVGNNINNLEKIKVDINGNIVN